MAWRRYLIASLVAFSITLMGAALPVVLCYRYLPAEAVDVQAVALLFAPSGMWLGPPVGLWMAGARKAGCALLALLFVLAAAWTAWWYLPLAWQISDWKRAEASLARSPKQLTR